MFKDYDLIKIKASSRPREILDSEINMFIKLLKQFIRMFHDIAHMENMNQLNFCWDSMVGQYLDMNAVLKFMQMQGMVFKEKKRNEVPDAGSKRATKEKAI